MLVCCIHVNKKTLKSTMERIYAFGIDCIQLIQYWCEGSEDYFEFVNELANPHYAFEIIFPLVCIIDSVFAAQFLLCISFGSWLNTIMKWWLLEDRPYWWVQNTSFYRGTARPHLHQYSQTCETGPGSPSGHSEMIAMQLVLYLMWISHFMNDRKCYVWWWKYIAYPLFGATLLSVMLARMYVASHFPHQCLLGALIGLFTAPALCIYISDPYIWGVGRDRVTASYTVFWHTMSVLVLGSISIFTYFTLKLSGLDPEWSIKLAYRWCDQPDSIRVSSLPLFALVQASASLLAWALAVTPEVAKYRHYTSQRSLLLAIIATYGIVTVTKEILKLVDKENEALFYLILFTILCLRAVLLIRAVPFLATFFYGAVERKKKKKA